jgi:hypothetical protein
VVYLVVMAKRNKKTAALKAGITFTSFLTQMMAITENKEKKKNLENTNRLLKAIRYLLGIEK